MDILCENFGGFFHSYAVGIDAYIVGTGIPPLFPCVEVVVGGSLAFFGDDELFGFFV